MRAPLRMLRVWPVRRLYRNTAKNPAAKKSDRQADERPGNRKDRNHHRNHRRDKSDPHRQPVVKSDLSPAIAPGASRERSQLPPAPAALFLQCQGNRIAACRTCGKSERPAAIARHRCKIRARFQFDTRCSLWWCHVAEGSASAALAVHGLDGSFQPVAAHHNADGQLAGALRDRDNVDVLLRNGLK